MRFTQRLMDEDLRVTFTLTIDFDALRLEARDEDGEPIDQTFDSLAAMQKVYRKRVAPLFEDERCQDLDRDAPAEPIGSLAAFADELRACGYDQHEPPRDPSDPVEVLVAELVTTVRRELNRALGPAETTLEHVVLRVGDTKVGPAIKDPPALAGLGEAEIAEHVAGPASSTWLAGDVLPFSLSHESLPWGEQLPALWQEPWQYGPEGLVGSMLELVAARIEAEPRLRANVTIPGGLTILFAWLEAEGVSPQRRARAREHLGGSALEYFRACAAG